MKTRAQSGFSIIELLVVVTIVLIIAAIAVPHYLSSKIAAKEAATVGSLRSITSALMVYTATYPAAGYPPSLPALSDGGSVSNCAPSNIPTSSNACLIDNSLAGGNKSGYLYTYAPAGSSSPPAGYNLNADPITRGVTGRRSFFTNVPGVIHWNATTSATESDPSIPM